MAQVIQMKDYKPKKTRRRVTVEVPLLIPVHFELEEAEEICFIHKWDVVGAKVGDFEFSRTDILNQMSPEDFEILDKLLEQDEDEDEGSDLLCQ